MEDSEMEHKWDKVLRNSNIHIYTYKYGYMIIMRDQDRYIYIYGIKGYRCDPNGRI